MADLVQPQWYVVHTYSGYENKVKANLEKTIENNGLEDMIQEISIPIEEAIEIKNNRRKTVQRKLLPGYVLVKMIMTDDSWYVVRNARGVTGFVGPSSKPVPLSDEEVEKLGMATHTVQPDFAVGENVQIVAGALEGFIGLVESIDAKAKKVSVKVSMFGRETPAELDFTQVKPL